MLPGISAAASARGSTSEVDVQHILKRNPYARTGLWCSIATVLNSTWAALHRSSLSDFRLSFLCEGNRRDGGVFKAAPISLFYDIPAWEFLKVRDLRFSSIFKAKPTRDRCLLDYPHTPTQDWKIFSYHERISTCFRNFADLNCREWHQS